MQRERQNRDERINPEDLIDDSRDFGSHRSMASSIFGERDPFDDPFFKRPLGSSFEPSIFDTHSSFDDMPHLSAKSSKGLVIEELDSDDEGDEGETHVGGSTSGKGPLVEHPDDEEEVKTDVRVNANHNRFNGTKPQSQSQSQGVSFKKVTYGGIDGAYYTATTTRKLGIDGVVFEDSKEADKTTGHATHRISKGIHDKGHSVTRKLGTDGKVDTTQTLHNLNEDELTGFEQAWEGNADRQFPGWNDHFNPFETAGIGSMRPFGLALDSRRGSNDNGARTSSSSGGRPKKVVRINID